MTLKTKYITLKEAAEISDYAPDYIGQLIRGGKIVGKQVCSNVAWLTTEESLKQYLEKNRTKKDKPSSIKDKITEKIQQVKNGIIFETKLARIFKVFLYIIIAVSILFSFFLFYIFSVNLEKKLEQKAIDKVQLKK